MAEGQNMIYEQQKKGFLAKLSKYLVQSVKLLKGELLCFLMKP